MSKIPLAGRRSLLLLTLLLPALAHAQAPPFVTLTSPNPEADGFFGFSVSGVPDADGDGHGDLLVGAFDEDGGTSDAGRAHLFRGATGALLRTLTSPNPELNGNFGRSVAGVPDADGDGRGDVLVGASSEFGGAPSAGRAYLFRGTTGKLLRTLTSPNPVTIGNFGRSVSGVADADGDGRGDVLVGAFFETIGGAPGAGRAYLFSGATGVLLRTLQSPNPQSNGVFGVSVSGVPDADGDGRDDLLIGASSEAVGGASGAGRAYLFSGATGALLRTLQSPNPGAFGQFGFSVSGVRDANGDGRGDLFVGAIGEGGEEAGRSHLFSGATGVLLRTLTSPNREELGFFGYSVSGVPDTDGDSRGDLLVGARDENGGAADAGRAYLFSGATGALLRTLNSPNLGFSGNFGASVSGVTDADGRGSLLVGASRESGGADRSGRAYLFPPSGGLAVAASGNPTTISPGGTVTVTVTVSNNTNQPVALDLWIVATRNDFTVLTRLIGSGTLPAGATVTRAFDLTAPGNTPPGTYTVNMNVGDFPNTVYALDAFEVTVTVERLSGYPPAEPFMVEMVAGDVFAADAFTSAAGSASPLVVVSPNPFSGQTALRFTLAEASPVRLSVYDVLGREVAVLVDGTAEAGSHMATFDGRAFPNGVYVVQLVSGGQVHTQPMTITR